MTLFSAQRRKESGPRVYLTRFGAAPLPVGQDHEYRTLGVVGDCLGHSAERQHGAD